MGDRGVVPAVRGWAEVLGSLDRVLQEGQRARRAPRAEGPVGRTQSGWAVPRTAGGQSGHPALRQQRVIPQTPAGHTSKVRAQQPLVPVRPPSLNGFFS